MRVFDRDEVEWYYRAGDCTLGPVPWREIEELLEDAFEAGDLLVTRAGDEDWVSAHRVLWKFEEADAQAGREGARQPLSPLKGVAPFTRKWPLARVEEWETQVRRLVWEDRGHYILGTLVLFVVSALSLMVCLPALHTGYYVMALHRFRGGAMEHCSIVDGFGHFRQAIRLYGLVLLMGLPLAAAGIVWMGSSVEPLDVAGGWTWMVIGTYWPIAALAMCVPCAAAFFAVPLMIDREMSAMDALRASWALTRCNYPRYLFLTLVLMVASGMMGHVLVFFLPLTLPLFPAGQVCLYEAEFLAE